MKALFFLLICISLYANEFGYKPLKPIEYDKKLAQIGKKFYFDLNLSPKKHSCNSCHDLTISGSGTDNLEPSKYQINTPTVLNIAYSSLFFKDASLTNIKEQVVRSLKDTMQVNEKYFKQLVNNNLEYKKWFNEANLEANFDNLANSLVEFEKALVTLDAPFDLYLNGNEMAISKNAKNGFKLFESYGCVYCHVGDNFGGSIIANIDNHFSEICDLNQTKVKVPSLRNISLTFPYGYSGKFKNLKDVVEMIIICSSGLKPPSEDVEDIIEFLKSLTGKRPKIMEN